MFLQHQRRRNIGRDHKFFNQPVAVQDLGFGYRTDCAFVIDFNFDFGNIQLQRPGAV